MDSKKLIVLLALLAFISYSASLVADNRSCIAKVVCDDGWWPDPSRQCGCDTDDDLSLECEGWMEDYWDEEHYELHTECRRDGLFCSYGSGANLCNKTEQ